MLGSGTDLLLFAEEGLFKSKASAGVLDYFVHGVGFDELKTVAKRASLANDGMDRNRAEGQRELQLDEFTYGDLELQQG